MKKKQISKSKQSGETAYWEETRLWSQGARVNLQEDRISFASSMIPREVKTVIDLGCGNGLFLNYLKTKKDNAFGHLLGLEMSGTALNYVETDRVQADVVHLPIRSKNFDLVTIMEVLEHLSTDHFSRTLNEITRISNKYILISVPFKEALESHFVECKKCKSRFHRNFHKQSFDTHTVASLLSGSGFRNTDIKYFGKKEELLGLSSFYNVFKRFNPPPVQIPLPCPVCGFVIGANSQRRNETTQGVYTILQAVYATLKRFWPKRYRLIWILALYKREI